MVYVCLYREREIEREREREREEEREEEKEKVRELALHSEKLLSFILMLRIYVY